MTSEDNKPVPPASIKPDARPAFASSGRGDDTIASHPIGATAGAVGGAAAGAVAGLAAGPVGSVAGAVIGAALGSGASGGTTGMMAAGAPKEALADAPDDHAAAYRYGEQARQRHAGRPWSEVEAELAAGWPAAAGDSGLDWASASPAVRAALERAER
ncbi:MAG: hypothetical protein ACK4PH_07950 [Aquincola tertiaricarbonis]|uniref:hypothetical protein n=1 Tax=Aquincola tertiaricarbonis TaxID=391953 RepID=UPI000614A898|nr:hypothetical protein [Aquincola tertiaricarbonis]